MCWSPGSTPLLLQGLPGLSSLPALTSGQSPDSQGLSVPIRGWGWSCWYPSWGEAVGDGVGLGSWHALREGICEPSRQLMSIEPWKMGGDLLTSVGFPPWTSRGINIWWRLLAAVEHPLHTRLPHWTFPWVLVAEERHPPFFTCDRIKAGEDMRKITEFGLGGQAGSSD